MAEYPVTELGKTGLILDESPDTIPIEAWSSGENVRFTHQGVRRAWGELDYLPNALPVTPFYILPSSRSENAWTVLVIGQNVVYASLTTSNTDVTPLIGWNADPQLIVTGTFINNLPVFNHPLNRPMFWGGLITAEAEPLPGLATNVRFGALRAFKNFLIGLGVQDGSAVEINPHKLRWSDPADPGSVPPNWDPAVDGSRAGDVILAETRGELIDCAPLGNVNYIYKNSSVYTMQFIGGNSVFKFDLKFDDFGVLSTDCIVPFKNFHFVVTTNDFIVHNGISWDSVANERIRRFFQTNLDSDHFNKTFATIHESEQEIYVFFPSRFDDEDFPTLVLIWNWETGAWMIRSCTPATCGSFGFQKDTDLVTWNTIQGDWDSQTFGWNTFFTPTMNSVVIYGDTSNVLHAIDDVRERQGVAYKTVVQRDAITFETTDRFGRPLADPNSHKLITEVWPTVKVESGTVDIYVGGQDDLEEPIRWEGPFVFDPAIDRFITPDDTQGKYISIRFESESLHDFLLEKYVIVFDEVGMYVGD